MHLQISAKTLRASLPEVVERVRKGARYTVIYRSRAAFQIVPIEDSGRTAAPLAEDPLYRAGAVGRSTDGRGAHEHDVALYGG